MQAPPFRLARTADASRADDSAGEVHRMMSRLPPSISVPQYIIEYSGGQAKNRAAAFP
jgi:hypothetical protein